MNLLLENVKVQKFIRNFSIIAHIDHGKSTLADRLIQFCGALEDREMKEQVLDNMDIERERGITIKAQTVRLLYNAQDNHQYTLNLIDTPGHVDFAYEVSRSLAACEGSLVVIDASQGVEAQTLANVYQAIDANHELVIVFNKIDLPAADVEKVSEQVENIIGIDTTDAILVSAKAGIGIKDLCEAIVKRIPCPKGDPEELLQALLIDSWYDIYLGVIMLVRVKNGVLRAKKRIRMMSSGLTYDVTSIGIFTPKKEPVEELSAGSIGFVVANIKAITDCKVGDTLTYDNAPSSIPLKGFKPSVPVVFCGLFPCEASEFEVLRSSLERLRLNDASFEFHPESSAALGFGFRCGFLGLLHLEIIQERLEREFGLNLVSTAPSVVYKLLLTNGNAIEIHNPVDMPTPDKIDIMEEPWIKATIMVPDEYLGPILTLCTEKRGEQKELSYIDNRAMLIYRLPLNEIVFDFYDKLKAVSRGYASFEYHLDGYQEADLVKLSILVNSDPVDALACIVHKLHAEKRGRMLCEKLKDLIPRQLFKIAIQASIGSKIIARETISALRKDVTAKCYGGDITRKRKLLDKQKEGKKRMRQIGNVDIPQSAFLAALKLST